MANIDESLYSRQLYAIGKDTMQSLVNSRVLIVGLDPLSVEICKNIILMGVGMITLNDDKIISENDYGNYYVSNKDMGKKRSDVLGKRLSELNTNCVVNKYSGIISKDVVSKYHLVVFTDFKFNDFLNENINKIITRIHNLFVLYKNKKYKVNNEIITLLNFKFVFYLYSNPRRSDINKSGKK